MAILSTGCGLALGFTDVTAAPSDASGGGGDSTLPHDASRPSDAVAHTDSGDSGVPRDGGSSADVVVDAEPDGGFDAGYDSSCPEAGVRCSDGGACVNLQTSSVSCGACGVACANFPCVLGECPAYVTALTAGGQLAYHDGYLYWTQQGSSNGSIARVAVGGGSPKTLIGPPDAGQLLPQCITVTDAGVYWGNRYGGNSTPATLGRVGFDGGDPVDLTPKGPLYGVYGVGLGPRGIYYTTGGSNTVVAIVGLDGGTPTPVVSGQATTSGIAVTATELYWTTSSAGFVVRAGLDGGGVTTIATEQTNPSAVIADSENLYWLDTGLGGSVMKWQLNGSSAVVTLASNQENPYALAADDTYVYWTNQGNLMNGPGQVMKVPIAGGAAITLAAGLSMPRGLAIDATNVYFINGSTEILKVPK